MQVLGDNTLRAQINHFQFYTATGRTSLPTTDDVVTVNELTFDATGYEIPELTQYLEQPMMVTAKRGRMKNLFVSRDEPQVVTNVKKFLLAEFQKADASSVLKLVKKQPILAPLQIPSHPKKIDIYFES